jgi:Gpi18-like mannosyltransferase
MSFKETVHRHAVWLPSAAILLTTLVVCIPYLSDFSIVFRQWDGPLYMYVAKTLYNIPADHPFHTLPPAYFACHFPMYPLLIRVLTLFTAGSYPWAMLSATLLSSCVAATLFYQLLKEGRFVESPVWTAVLFAVFPGRWVLCHSVGESEGLFFCFVFAALLSLMRGKTGYLLLWILLASLTRITGILLVPAAALTCIHRREWKKLWLLPLPCLGIVCLFTFYYFRFGDFFAYFTWNLDKEKLIQPVPLAVYRLYASKVNAHSTEFYGLLYFLHLLGTLALWKRKELFFYCAVFYLFNLFVYHWDMSRYFLPITPFALLVAMDSLFSSAPLRWIVFLLAAYLGITFATGWLPYHSEPLDQYRTVVGILHR